MKKIIMLMIMTAALITTAFADPYLRRVTHARLEHYDDDIITIEYISSGISDEVFDYWIDYTNLYEADNIYGYCCENTHPDCPRTYRDCCDGYPGNLMQDKIRQPIWMDCVLIDHDYMIIYIYVGFND